MDMALRISLRDGEKMIVNGAVLRSVGRTDLPYSDHDAMAASLERLTSLDPTLIVWPGHGPDTTVGRELATNPFLTSIVRPGG